MPLPATIPTAVFGAGAGASREVGDFEGVGGAAPGTGLGTGMGMGGCSDDWTATSNFSSLRQLPGAPLMK